MSCDDNQLDASSISIIKKFLNSELLDESDFELEQTNQKNKKPQQFNLNQMLEQRKGKNCQIKEYESQENRDLNYLIGELRLEQQNFQAELEHIQRQFIQEINFVMQKVFDQNKLYYKQQEYQLNLIQQKRQKLSVQSPQQSHSFLYQMNPNLQQYQKFNKEIKNSLVKLLHNIKTAKIYQETFTLQDQQYDSQTSRSPLAQLNKLFSRQGSLEKKQPFTNRITNSNMKLNLVMPMKRDTQSFWNQPSERKCSMTSKLSSSPYEKRDKCQVQQALYKQSSDFLKFRC
ncbi:unnamed protein product (macronuclear) [Paramecium tetraurelia]|uniref:Uncharacterized protein n=1 Tax=Paramecium tetraurelia TaxID=5888 RepID=A0D7I9_PARTE|nr:uncharacterized protein GSPATT00002048001 [Paramecium tetraurelia]CAK79006.1 unnamed protein product [Paramecium tetraurelia]|eukprot:XP_001446403.1 hypothetical protein (macronuclear) [Paramecium tetraurelia strain d4-2]